MSRCSRIERVLDAADEESDRVEACGLGENQTPHQMLLRYSFTEDIIVYAIHWKPK
jgi:hypothetical protein